MELQQFDVRAVSKQGDLVYRVTAKTRQEAQHKVATLHEVLNWPLQEEVRVLTKKL